ncbi:MAG: thymidine phosphorylase [Balneolales bacterium]
MRYNIATLIRKKRDNETLSAEEIGFLIREYTHGVIPDYQMSAFLMAAFINGLDDSETAALTREMLHSGSVLDLSEVPGIKIDKHSTGGVGDKTSLILAPVVAACGVPVPMISGRGLGHTGGTLDKLESIPGFNVNLDSDRFVKGLKKHKLAIIGAGGEIAPADKRMYALRDVTATVESIPLIAGSIMSKKLAEGIDGLVLDVKFGSGAFMNTREQAIQLAQELVAIGEEFDKRTIAWVTNMDQPLGHNIGNWLEVLECLECLNGNGPEDLMMVTHQLAGTMIYLGGQAASIEAGMERSKLAISDGSAMQKFRDIVEEQEGSIEYLDRREENPAAKFSFEITAPGNGYISSFNTYVFGMAGVALGAGRTTMGEMIDPQAGIILEKKIGNAVDEGEIIARCFTNKNGAADMARQMLKGAVTIDLTRPETPRLITDKITIDGIQAY